MHRADRPNAGWLVLLALPGLATANILGVRDMMNFGSYCFYCLTTTVLSPAKEPNSAGPASFSEVVDTVVGEPTQESVTPDWRSCFANMPWSVSNGMLG